MAFVAYFVVFVWFMGRSGIPFDRERLLLWIVGGLAVVSIGRPWRTLPRMFLDWSIFIIGVTLYDFARGAATFVDAPIQVTPQADIDKIFGLGNVPTVWLQDHFLHAQPNWWDAAASIIYATPLHPARSSSRASCGRRTERSGAGSRAGSSCSASSVV